MTFEARYAEGRPERLPELAEDLRRRNVAIIIVPGMVATRGVAEVVKTVPIVSATADPIAIGVAQSLARPGGNVTGLTVMAGDRLVEKWVALLKEVAPRITRAGLIFNPRNVSNADMPRIAGAAGQMLDVDVVATPVPEAAALPAALATIDAAKVQGLCLAGQSADRADRICRQNPAADRLLLSRVYRWRRLDILWFRYIRRLASCRPLRGQNPERGQARRLADRAADQIPTGHQLETREGSGGLTIPDKLLALADEVIE